MKISYKLIKSRRPVSLSKWLPKLRLCEMIKKPFYEILSFARYGSYAINRVRVTILVMLGIPAFHWLYHYHTHKLLWIHKHIDRSYKVAYVHSLCIQLTQGHVVFLNLEGSFSWHCLIELHSILRSRKLVIKSTHWCWNKRFFYSLSWCSM